MLITCKECGLQLSDKAFSCPHCGFPMVAQPKYKRTNKRKRLPNGFGQISEIKNQNLRKRFRAMVTTGKRKDGKLIVQMLKPEAYFATYNEAYEALLEYNKNPYDLSDDITMTELFERWLNEYKKTLKNDSSIRTITSSWNYCYPIYHMRAKDVRARHLKACIDEGKAKIKGIEKEASPNMKSRIKSTFNLMFDYALEYELVDRNYARTFSLSDDVIVEQKSLAKSHLSFSDEEMETLWENISHRWVRVLLIQCYMGWRPQELGLINISDVDLKERTIVGGIKTEAGENRIVPIHPKIYRFVCDLYEEAISLDSQYLINCTDTKSSSIKLTYDKYNYRFEKLVEVLDLNENHRPHDGRKQFVTMAKKYNVDEYAIKRMVGHEIKDVTEKVYTDRSVEWLRNEIEKIK